VGCTIWVNTSFVNVLESDRADGIAEDFERIIYEPEC
jgi:hypothetical protein